MLTISVSDTLTMSDLAGQLPYDPRIIDASLINYLRRYLNDVVMPEG